MNLTWAPQAWEAKLYWQKTDKAALKRLNALIENAMRTPFEGIGKPEPLKFNLAGYWSRRIDAEHRLVYTIDEVSNTLTILQCRYHY